MTSSPLLTPASTIKHIQIAIGQSLLIETPGLTRAGVGDPKIAGVLPIAKSEVLLNGKTSGATSVIVWANGQHTVYDVHVHDSKLATLAHLVRETIGNSAISVSTFERSIIVKGTLRTPEDVTALTNSLTQLQSTAAAARYTIVDMAKTTDPLAVMWNEIHALPGASHVDIAHDGKGDIIVSGQATDRAAAERILERVQAHAGATLAIDGKIIDRITLQTTTQVDVKVYVLEVDDTAMSQLGLRLQAGTPNPTTPNTLTLGPPSFPILEAASGINKSLTAGAFYRNVVLAPTLDLILNTGHARILSQPDLVTLPGREATFLVGGQIPIPFASGPGQIAIDYKQYGVQLKMTPTILPSGKIETVITPEVSDLDFADGITLNGYVVPALQTSRISTDVVTGSGESIVMGGLMRRMEQRNITKIPLLGDLPILGPLFRSVAYQKSNTDLIFVLTPQILTR